MGKGFGFRSSLFFFVLINVAWLGLVALWVYYSVNNYQTIRKISLNLQFGPEGLGPPWIVWFGAGVLMLFLLLGVIVIYTYYRKQAGLNLLQQNFISSVTHELKSPLASLQLYLETLAFRDPSPADRQTFLRRMQEETERLSGLIHNILLVSQLQRSRLPYSFQWIRLDERVQEHLEEKKRRYGWKDEQLVLEIAREVRARVDWDNLQVALDNIVENAVRYSPNGFWLRARLAVEGKRCVLSFQDKGIGIPRDQLGRIFRMFHRAVGAKERVLRGTGIGLFIASSIVRAHGGRIFTQSEGPGKGATFVIHLPLSGPSPRSWRRPDLWFASAPLSSHERAESENPPRGG